MPGEDWRNVAAAELEPVYQRERSRWLAELGWETEATWSLVEEGRRAGRVPGFVRRDDAGRLSGWCFFSTDRATVHVGIVDAERAEVVRDLIDQVLDAPEATYAKRFQAFLYPRSPAVAVALQRRRFSLNPQLLLSCQPDQVDTAEAGERLGRPWHGDDLPGFVRLLARAYAGTAVAEAFAPDGLLDQWVAYVRQLIGTPACGTFLPEASFMVPGETLDRLAGAILTTNISPGILHVAQVATDPLRRRCGMARRLVTQVCAHAASAGAREVSLVVDERNLAARALYDRMGFTQRGTLLLASRGRLTRSTAHATEAAVAGF
jgi:ribosomal protein S18 acetylase RimI-like enzyme